MFTKQANQREIPLSRHVFVIIFCSNSVKSKTSTSFWRKIFSSTDDLKDTCTQLETFYKVSVSYMTQSLARIAPPTIFGINQDDC